MERPCSACAWALSTGWRRFSPGSGAASRSGGRKSCEQACESSRSSSRARRRSADPRERVALEEVRAVATQAEEPRLCSSGRQVGSLDEAESRPRAAVTDKERGGRQEQLVDGVRLEEPAEGVRAGLAE